MPAANPSLWNSRDQTGGGFSYSNGNKTVANGGGGGSTVRSEAWHPKSDGKLCFEIFVNSDSGNSNFTIRSLDNLSWVGIAANGAVFDSTIGQIATLTGYGTGSTLRFHFDMPNKLMWVMTDGVHWNNSSTADPATGVGGVAYNVNVDPAFIGYFCGNFGDSATLVTAAADFAFPIASGFTAWGSGVDAREQWNPEVFFGGGATYSNGNKTVVVQNSNSVILTQQYHTDGNWYAEVTAGATVDTDSQLIGVSDIANFWWTVWDDIGECETNSSTQQEVNISTTLPTFAANHVGAIFVRLDLLLVFFRNVTTNSNWNGNPAADPLTGVGGFPIPQPFAGAPVYISMFTKPGQGWTFNGTGPFAGTVPAGAKAWSAADMGTIFLQTVNIACAGSIAAAKGSAKHLAIACAGTISRTKQIAKRLAVACSGTVAATKASAKHLAIACAGAVSVAKASAKRLAVACAGSVTAATSAVRIFSQTVNIACTGTVSSAKASAKHLAVACAGAVSVATSSVRIFLQTVNIACTGSASVAKASAKHLALACSGSVAAAKSTAKRVAVACAGSVAAVKNTTRHLAIACAGSITSSTARVFLQTINIAITGSAAVVKSTGKHLAVACSGSVAATKASAKSIAVACHGSVTAVKRTAKGIAISLSLTLSLLTVKLGPRAVLFRIVVLVSAALARVGISTGGAQSNVKTAASNTTITEAD